MNIRIKTAFLFLFLFAISFANAQVIHDKNIEVRMVPDFTGIKVSGGINVYLSQSNEYALGVSASKEEFRSNIKTEVKNGILNIYYDGSSFFSSSPKDLRVYISFKKLENMKLSGACDAMFVNSIKASDFKLEVSGASTVGGNVAIGNLQLTLSGASTLKIDGKVENLKINASGASDMKNYNLNSENCTASVSGASDIRVTVGGSLNVKASGASTFFYKGNPSVTQADESGASEIRKKN